MVAAGPAEGVSGDLWKKLLARRTALKRLKAPREAHRGPLMRLKAPRNPADENRMQTLSEILPAIPLPTAQRWAATLTGAGLLSPLTQGDGLPFLYETADAETLREFTRLRREERLGVAQALQALGAVRRIEAPQSAPAEAPQAASKPIEAPQAGEAEGRAAELAREAETLRQELAQERAAREADATQARAQEIARIEAERRALEAARATDEAKREARDATNAATIAHQSASAAVAKLTAARRRVERLTVWGRLRAAIAFVIRKEVDGALLLLPERAESRKDDQAKAA